MLSVLVGMVLMVGVLLKQFMPLLFRDISDFIVGAGSGSGGRDGDGVSGKPGPVTMVRDASGNFVPFNAGAGLMESSTGQLRHAP